MTPEDLPPLPPYLYGRELFENERVWNKEQMRAYATEAVLQDRAARAPLTEIDRRQAEHFGRALTLDDQVKGLDRPHQSKE